MKCEAEQNVYLKMDIRRVVEDARHGVFLAMAALRRRDPAAARALGIGLTPEEANGKPHGGCIEAVARQ